MTTEVAFCLTLANSTTSWLASGKSYGHTSTGFFETAFNFRKKTKSMNKKQFTVKCNTEGLIEDPLLIFLPRNCRNRPRLPTVFLRNRNETASELAIILSRWTKNYNFIVSRPWERLDWKHQYHISSVRETPARIPASRLAATLKLVIKRPVFEHKHCFD